MYICRGSCYCSTAAALAIYIDNTVLTIFQSKVGGNNTRGVVNALPPFKKPDVYSLLKNPM